MITKKSLLLSLLIAFGTTLLGSSVRISSDVGFAPHGYAISDSISLAWPWTPSRDQAAVDAWRQQYQDDNGFPLRPPNNIDTQFFQGVPLPFARFAETGFGNQLQRNYRPLVFNFGIVLLGLIAIHWMIVRIKRR